MNSGPAVDVAVITDDPDEQGVLLLALSEAGFRVAISSTKRLDVENVLRSHPHVVFCDYAHPTGEGVELCREMRGSPASGEFYLVLMSPDTSGAAVTQALEAGADDFLVKPLDGRAATSRVRVGMRLWSMQERLRKAAITDGLTGLYNHDHFNRILEAETSRARRYAQPLSLVMIDVDFFKSINDTFGHLAGNETLERIGRLLLNSVRTMDTVGRFGGDEFAVLLPQATVEVAIDVVERIRRAISETLRIDAFPDHVITASFGLADSNDSRVTTAAALLDLADRALYLAKRRGRNQIAHCGELTPLSNP